MNIGSFFRTLFNCSHWDEEMEKKKRRDEEKRNLLKGKISLKSEKIAEKTRDIEAGAELVSILMKDMTR